MLVVRKAKLTDVDSILSLTTTVYPTMLPYSKANIRGQINNFPEGQYVAEYEGKIVGYCASIVVGEKNAGRRHTWDSITGRGYGTTHDPAGSVLYGIEVCVDPAHRNLRIGHRFYRERKKLCEYMRLKGIVFGGRIPGYKKRAKQYPDPMDYVRAVQNKDIRDTILGFHLRQGFEVIGVLKDYLPNDEQSCGYAVHLYWKNPKVADETGASGVQLQPGKVRVGTVQYMQRRVKSFEEFKKYVEYFVDVVASYNGDFVVFPELFTLQLLSIENKKVTPAQSIEALTKYTETLKSTLSELAVRYNINIIGGSHPTRTSEGHVRNISYVCLRQGTIYEQEKIHPTPDEGYWWNIEGGETLNVIPTDCGPIGVLICYDCEFPELARHLINQGARMLFVPFCTDERQSYLRVRYCAQARAVENQCFVVLSGNVGNLPGVVNMDIQYAQSCILTPCDFPFARDGIAADTTPNSETVALADLRIEDLNVARSSGTVQNLKNRRHDLYSVVWKKD